MSIELNLKEPLTKIKVAVADDSVMLRDFMVDGLIREGDIAVLMVADNGRQLIDRLASVASLPDICIIDGCMPEMDGFETITIIKKRWPGIKVIAFSVYDYQEYIEHMKINGADAFLMKSMAGRVLAKSIRELYHTGLCQDSLFDPKKPTTQKSKNQSVILKLTPKQMEVWQHGCTDATYKEIAVRMKTSFKAVEGYRDKLYEVIKAKNRTDLIVLAFQHGLFTISSEGKRVWRYVP